MELICRCGKKYTIPQVDNMVDKKINCEVCDESPRKFELIKFLVIKGGQVSPLYL